VEHMNDLVNSVGSRQARPSIGAEALVVLALLGLVGCASTSVERGRVLAPLDELPKPPVLLVYDFAVSADDVMVDTFGPALLTSDGDPSERVEVGREVQSSLSKTLVAKLGEKGIRAKRAHAATQPAPNSLLLKGQFISIDEGDAMGRTVIGFGRGAKELRVAMQAYQMTAAGPRQLLEGKGTSKGGKRPGMFVPVVGGAALGTAATSAVISASVSVVAEASGKFNTDVKKLAEEISERAVQFYIDRGWL